MGSPWSGLCRGIGRLAVSTGVVCRLRGRLGGNRLGKAFRLALEPVEGGKNKSH